MRKQTYPNGREHVPNLLVVGDFSDVFIVRDNEQVENIGAECGAAVTLDENCGRPTIRILDRPDEASHAGDRTRVRYFCKFDFQCLARHSAADFMGSPELFLSFLQV